MRSYRWAVINVTVSGDRAFKGIMKFNRGH